ncbi:MAG: hypothetical protein U0Q18_37100 [Bryobacteraceae bacterium]
MFQVAATLMAQSSARATEVIGCHVAEIAGFTHMLYYASDDFETEIMAGNPPALLIARKVGPSVIFASVIQVRSAAAIQSGTV